MDLTSARLHQRYLIRAVHSPDESPVSVRLRQLGFVEGMEVVCEARAPILKNPFLIRIRGIQVALTAQEARLLEIEEAR
jgi:Fe2+ transport system protein FeoA